MTTAPTEGLRRRVLGRFADEAPTTRAHLALRWRTLPMAALLDAVPRTGAVLELGCGHGLVSLALAEDAPARSITAVDIDPTRIATARRAAARGRPLANVEPEIIAPDAVPSGPLDGFVVVDALYLLPAGRQRAMILLLAAAAALRPGGVVVVKELDDRPRAKAWFARCRRRPPPGS